ncbi:uncharacterized protein LOC113294666 [Papaver somniferum]|uniref:uncharacterized protein LOC113294666 n=1 Tax=Papaver somniferum TaxID=3469 RepID=UPI000E70093A|nr:uncharacterized protein LOC113294666 [Papaver somniferum]
MKYIYRGFWEIEAQVLRLRFWERDFKPELQKTSTAFVWIGFPGLCIEYWTENILMEMERALGRPIWVDETTLKKDIGYYASIYVEIDLAKVIPNKVWVETEYGKFEQEYKAQVENNGGFTSTLESPKEFPVLSAEKVLEVGTSIPSLNNNVGVSNLVASSLVESDEVISAQVLSNITAETDKMGEWKDVLGKASKSRKLNTIVEGANGGKTFISPRKFNALIDVPEKQDISFPKVIGRPTKGKVKGIPTVTTRNQASNLVKMNPGGGSSNTSQISQSQ